jgi:hypothetical protein
MEILVLSIAGLVFLWIEMFNQYCRGRKEMSQSSICEETFDNIEDYDIEDIDFALDMDLDAIREELEKAAHHARMICSGPAPELDISEGNSRKSE